VADDAPGGARELRDVPHYDQLFPGAAGTHRPPDRSQSPHLFSVFLDPSKSVKASKSVSFAFDLKVLVPDYVVDGRLFMKRHYEGGFIYRELILVEAFRRNGPGGWRIKYGYQDINPGKPGKDAKRARSAAMGPGSPSTFRSSRRPGQACAASLRIEARPWS
jgi:hypothetical protein